MKKMGLMWCAALVLGCASSAPQQRPDTADTTAHAAATEGAPAEGKDAKAEGTKAEGKDAQAKADPDKLVCQDVRVTGSRLPQRVCRTARQVEAEREAARRMMDNAGRAVQTIK